MLLGDRREGQLPFVIVILPIQNGGTWRLPKIRKHKTDLLNSIARELSGISIKGAYAEQRSSVFAVVIW